MFRQCVCVRLCPFKGSRFGVSRARRVSVCSHLKSWVSGNVKMPVGFMLAIADILSVSLTNSNYPHSPCRSTPPHPPIPSVLTVILFSIIFLFPISISLIPSPSRSTSLALCHTLSLHLSLCPSSPLCLSLSLSLPSLPLLSHPPLLAQTSGTAPPAWAQRETLCLKWHK